MKLVPTLLEYLYRAVASPYGVVINITPMDAGIQALYRARRESGDPILNGLQFRRSPRSPNTQVWIIKDEARGKTSEEVSREFVRG